MTEKTGPSFGDADPRMRGAVIGVPEVDAWFEREILPLEAALMQFLQHNWRNRSDISDLRQDIYVRVYEAALKEIPQAAKPFLFKTARNLLISQMRHEQVVPFEAVSDIDALETAIDEPGPESAVVARDELRRLQTAVDKLPPRAREAFLLRQAHGLTGQEIAARMGVAEATVKFHLKEASRILADLLYGELASVKRPK